MTRRLLHAAAVHTPGAWDTATVPTLCGRRSSIRDVRDAAGLVDWASYHRAGVCKRCLALARALAEEEP